jgi:hypothetical protein
MSRIDRVSLFHDIHPMITPHFSQKMEHMSFVVVYSCFISDDYVVTHDLILLLKTSISLPFSAQSFNSLSPYFPLLLQCEVDLILTFPLAHYHHQWLS